jgi:hypothetical protein
VLDVADADAGQYTVLDVADAVSSRAVTSPLLPPTEAVAPSSAPTLSVPSPSGSGV